MSRAYENLYRFGSLHRGDVGLQWHPQNAICTREMINLVASEIQGNLRLARGDDIVPPPDEFCHAFDEELAEALRHSIPRGKFSGKIHVVAHTLTIIEAVNIARLLYYENGCNFGGIGCGTLIIPKSIGCDRYPLSYVKWKELIAPIPYIPLYECEMLIVNDLQT